MAHLNSSTFLGPFASTIQSKTPVVIKEGPNSSKDYIWIDDVVESLYRISKRNESGVYNVASGESLSHSEIANIINQETGVQVSFSENSIDRILPSIDNKNILMDFPDLSFTSAEDAVRKYFRKLKTGIMTRV